MPERGFLILWIFLLFFSEFCCPVRVRMEFGTKLFSLFLGLSHPVLAKNNAGNRFFNFFNFFGIFFGIFLPRLSTNWNRGKSTPVLAKNNAGKWFFNFLNFFTELSSPGQVWTEFGTKIFFLSYSAYLLPFRLKIKPERDFLIFWFFLLLFWNFLPRAVYEQNSGLKFFSHFRGLSDPVLAKNNAGTRFFNFFNFFAIFFGIFFPRPSKNENRDNFFFLSFPAYLLPVLAKSNFGNRFFNFLIFYNIFFWNFLALVGYKQNSRLKFFSLFLGLSNPNLAKNNAE